MQSVCLSCWCFIHFALFSEISDRPFKSLSQEKRASDSVEDLLKQIGATKDDSIEAEDPALEKDSSLEDGLDSTLNNGESAHATSSLYEVTLVSAVAAM